MFEAIIYAFVMVIVGFLGMRLAGRKSISRMTIAQTVIMIAIGSILVEPVKNKDIGVTTVSIFVFVGVLILLEWLSSISMKFESWIVGDKKVVILNGKICHSNLKKLRMTVDQLEMNLRQKGITNIQKIKTATLEANGQIGYEYFDQFKGVNKKDLENFKEQTIYHLQEIYNQLEEIKKK